MKRMNEKRASLVGPAKRGDDIRKFQFDFLKSKGLKPEHVLFDIGCGVLRGGIPLIGYLDAGNYYGIEPREHVLDEGRKELVERGLEHKAPHLIVGGDFSELRPLKRFDCVWAYSVLFHMENHVVAQCLRFVSANLADGGVMFGNVRIGESSSGRWKEFPNIARSLVWYEKQARDAGLKNVKVVGNMESCGLKGVKNVKHKLMLRLSR
jgi:cyclopropane fatty-acyl-phospholipid synthase-like methyltransferase